MDDTLWGQHGLSPHVLCRPSENQKLELRSTVELQENATPVSKLCDTLTATALEDPVQLSKQCIQPMAVDSPQSLSIQNSAENPSFSHLNTPLQTPVSSPLRTLRRSLRQARVEVPLINGNSPVSSVSTPLCIPLGIPFDIRNVNTTPRNKASRSGIKQLCVSELDQQIKEADKSSSLKDGSQDVNIFLSKCDGVDSKNDELVHSGTSVEDRCDISILEEKKDLQFQEKSAGESANDRQTLSTVGHERKTVTHVPSPSQSNKLHKVKITSEPKFSRKSDVIGASARRLSFSAKKSSNKPKNIVSEYDPDNDIFAHGLMPIQFNIDSLKHKIGQFLNSPNSPSPDLKRSSSCGALNVIDSTVEMTPRRSVPSVSSRRKQSKPPSQKPSTSTMKRTASAPELHAVVPFTPNSDIKKASEGTIRAFLRARDIIKNIKQRARNACKLPTQTVKFNSEAESRATNSEILAADNVPSPSCGNTQNCETFVPDRNQKDLRSQLEYNCSSLDEHLPPTQPFESFILCDVTAFVDVISNNEDISVGIRKELMKLGATVVQNFTKEVPITHVVFNDGHISTYQKAKKRKIPLVSVLWIEECRKTGVKVHESLFPPYQIERYESPSVVKQLKKRRIMHLYSDERRRQSPRQKKEMPKSRAGSPSNELSAKGCPLRKSIHVPKWVDEVAGGNGMMRILVGMAGIGKSEFQSIMNRPPTPDSDSEPEQNSPLPVRLLRKMAKNIPADQNLICDSTPKSSPSSCSVNSPLQNSFSQKLQDVSDLKMDDIYGIQADSTKEENKLTTGEHENNPTFDLEHSRLVNITQRKKVPKRKLLSPIEETIAVVADCDGDVEEGIIVDNPHNFTPKRLSVENKTKKRKSSCGEETSSQDVTISKAECDDVAISEMNVSEKNTVYPIRRSRRSSSYFVKKKSSPSISVQKPALVCTLLPTVDVDLIVSIVDKLGVFVVDKNVSSHTTHIVAGACKRTMKILKGMVRGCWIVSNEWVLKSLEAGKWLDEEEFELTVFSPAVQKYRLEKLSFGTMFQPDIFSSCGPIFVSSRSAAPRSDLVELILLCGGKCASRVSKAEIVVGKHHTGVICVTALWVLDSVQYYCCKPPDSYLCT